MRFSRNWIADYTDLPQGSLLHEAMSMLGLVVDDARPNGDDVTLDLDFPSNRPDAMNHLGIARELAIAADQPLRHPAVEFAVDADLASTDLASVEISDAACVRFVARVVTDVVVAASPKWLRVRLEAIGLRPINNVVDITNFVMWEIGRPMHAYDLDKLPGGALVVRRAAPGERLITLDDIDRELSEEDLVIADQQRVVGMAGVMGGNDTGVTDTTKRVVLECAFFDAVTIRRMARRHGMHTDASHRFERGLSVQDIDEAVERACGLLHDLAGATISTSSIDAVGELPEARRIVLRSARLRGLLGVEVSPQEVSRILTGLGFGLQPHAEGVTVTVPARRVDVVREVDLIEEVARFHGYDQFPNTLPLLRRRAGGGLEPVLLDEMRLRRIAASLGFWEAMTFVFSSAADQAPFVGADSRFVELANPLSEAFAVMQRNLTPGLLAAAGRNRSAGQRTIRLFEIGRTFALQEGASAVDERRRLGLLAVGDVAPSHWSAASRTAAFSDMKGAAETVWQRMRWPALSWSPAPLEGMQAGTGAEISCGGTVVGFAGKIDPAVAATVSLGSEVWVAELDIEGFAGREQPPIELSALPRYPASERDISLLVKNGTPYAGVTRALDSAVGIPLVNHRLLGRYEGDDLPDGTSVWTLRLTYRSDERTLTAEEIEAAHEAAVERLRQELDAERR